MDRRPSGSPFVFPGETGTGHAEIYNVEKTLRRACMRAGVKPFSPHGLRHFYATEMLRNGAKLEVVGRITRPLEHRDYCRHLQVCEDGRDARGAPEVRICER